ncbi:MAG: pirin family protein [Pedobacter sp.]|nr:MAG: pirin family protein [Pedobacter sp.]
MSNTILHLADTRGMANHGWLKSAHSFSFAGYYAEDRVHFGALRVLNDDDISGGMGFGEHPHDNMEIITIPLSGALKHQDSMGNSAVIEAGEIQVMSAGTGIYHSEFNANANEAVTLLQIWLFPNKRNVSPRYEQRSLKDWAKINELYQVLSPNQDDQGVWIHQDAWFHMGNFQAGKKQNYTLKKSGSGLYIFVIKGQLEINGNVINTRDGLGIWNTSEFNFKSNTDSEFLVMEVPMEVIL